MPPLATSSGSEGDFKGANDESSESEFPDGDPSTWNRAKSENKNKNNKNDREGNTFQKLPIKAEKPIKPKAKKPTRISKQGGKPKGVHNEFTHFPHDPNCHICIAARLQKAARASNTDANARPDALLPAMKFGDRITADHAVMNDDNKSAEDEALNACVIQDGFSNWLQSYPCKTKGAADTLRSFQKFLGPDVLAKHVYTDNSKEFAAALQQLCVCHDTCTPYTPASNGIVERAVRRVKEGTAGCLIQSGLSDRWWHKAMMTFCYLRNIHDLDAEGKTAYEKRFGVPFAGPIIPFGAGIQYKPNRPKEIDELKWTKNKPGLFAGYVLNAGGGWTGDVDVLDAVELTNAQMHSEVNCRRISHKEIDIDKGEKGEFTFPVIFESWEQPVDSKNMTRTIRKKIFGNDREDKTFQNEAQDEAKFRRKERRKERKLSDKDHKAYCDFDDMMPEEEMDASAAAQSDSADESHRYPPDKWILTSHVLIRQHNRPRKTLFTPSKDENDPSPIPIKFLDIMGRADTSCNSLSEFHLEDFWTDRAEAKRELSEPWMGRTAFSLKMPPAKPGYEWQSGRETRVQGESKRPPSIWVEEWRQMSDPNRLKAIAAWEKEKAARDKMRASEGLIEAIPPEDLKDYHAIMKISLKRYKEETPPAMACYGVERHDREGSTSQDLLTESVHGTGLIATTKGSRTHQSRMDYLQDKQSEEYYALIHTAIPDKKVYQIPEAKAAVDKEWDKLFKRGTFDLSSVGEKRDVVQRYKQKGGKVHFGTLRTLRHEKHSELPMHLRTYKGRVVFRGDIVKDEEGWYAVFSEQGTSSSHIAATKFMDALARCPGNHGEGSDAVAAYTQVRIDEDLTYLLGKGSKFVDTWVSIPRNRWPQEWKKSGAHWDDPQVRVRRNIYGHKWQRFCGKNMQSG